MINVILTGAVGILLLGGFSFLLVWLDERAKKRTRERLSRRFQDFDKYYDSSDSDSESQLEEKRIARMQVLGYKEEVSESIDENVDMARFSGKGAM